MSARAVWAVDLKLGASYRETILAEASLEGYWPMDEFSGTVADDASANAHDGTYVNAPDLGLDGPCPEGGSAANFNTTESMDVADDADHRPANLSVEIWVHSFPFASLRAVAIKSNASLTNGFGFRLTAADAFEFFVGSTATVVSAALEASTWTHFLGTYDGTNLRLYKNGVLVAGPTAGPGAIVHSSTTMRVGTHAGVTESLAGRVAHFAIYSAVLDEQAAAAHYAAGVWTDVTDDVDGDIPITIRRGIRGFTPRDRMASPGIAQLAVKNHRLNSGGVRSYYSPGHPNCRAYFTFGIPIRIRAAFDGTTWIQFRGKVHGIKPSSNTVGPAATWITAHDCLYDLAQHAARQVSLLVDQTEVELMQEILGALPRDARPASLSLTTAVDTFPYGFDDLGNGRKVLDILAEVMVNSQGLGFATGSGALVYWSRAFIQTLSPLAAFVDGHLVGLEVASDLENVFNRIRIRIYPTTVDVSTVVLYSHPGLIEVAPGETKEIWGSYRHPTQLDLLCGGFDMEPGDGTQTLATPDDYLANSAADGSGSNISADVVVVASFFASTVKYVITNNHVSSTAHLGAGTNQLLQSRGKGVYRLAPVTVEAFDEMPYGERPLDLDFRYQDDSNVAQDQANTLLAQLKNLQQQPRSFTVDPQRSDELMTATLSLASGAIGYPISITEGQTGLEASDVFIRSVDITVGPQGHCRVTFGVTPRTSQDVWQLDIDELDTETILGAG